MNAETLEALNKSIEHWNRLATGTQEPREQIYSDDCALCEMFSKPSMPVDEQCKECPVHLATGRKHCSHVYWWDAQHAWMKKNSEPEPFKKAAAEIS